jgi:hypothetical protein
LSRGGQGKQENEAQQPRPVGDMENIVDMVIISKGDAAPYFSL